MESTASEGSELSTRQPLLDVSSVIIVVLTALQPFAGFVMANATKLAHPGTVLPSAVAWTVFMTIAFLVVRLLTRDTPPLRVAAAFVGFSIAFWNFALMFPYEPPSEARRWVGLVIWALLAALLVVLAVKLSALAHARTFLLILLTVAVVVPLLNFALLRGQVFGGDDPSTYAGPPVAPFSPDPPDVYWFVLDEHARSDQLLKWTGADNSWFSDGLAERGFSTSETTQSAYLHTHLSIPSTLAMAYSFVPGQDYRGEYVRAADMLENNPVMDTFAANGYQVIYAPDGSVEWTRCPQSWTERVCLPTDGGALAQKEPGLLLLRSTPLGSLPWPVVHSDPVAAVQGVEEVRDPNRPAFVMAHILSPHGPFRYRPDCSFRDHWPDGHHFSGEERAAAYAVDAECIDRAVLTAVDDVLAVDPDAVIIVQSDHGSRLTFDWATSYADSTPAQLIERFAAVNAIRLPDECRDDSIEGTSLVNTFRIVFACLAGVEPDLLPNRTYFSEFGKVETLVEVPADAFEP